MANPEHVEIVKQGSGRDTGVAREETQMRCCTSLRQTSRGADLRGADLRARRSSARTDLREANLVGADLREADLREAHLSGADLRRGGPQRGEPPRGEPPQGGPQRGKPQRGEPQRGEPQRGGPQRGEPQRGEPQRGEPQRGVPHGGGPQRKRCVLRIRSLVVSIYRSRRDSMNAKHDGPSTIGVDTLYMSKGKIPEAFLRGCGVPDELIAYLPSLLGAQQPIQFYSCFISHSHKDEEFCKRLCSRMRDENLRVWYAPEDMKGGRKIHEQIDAAIRVHDKLLLVLSEHSMASEWVKTEVGRAREREVREARRVLFPIRLVPFESDSELGSIRRRYRQRHGG
jgi:hypothetical protein